MTDREFKDFKEGATSSIADVVGSLSGFERQWDLTARGAARAMEQMVAKSRQMARAYKELDRTAIPDGFRRWLLEQGPDAVHAFVEMSKREQDRFVANWKETGRNVEDAVSTLPAKLEREGIESGRQFGLGLIDGMERMHMAVTEAARALAEAAVAAARAALQPGSPSKVTARLGKQFVEGLIQGIESEEDKAVRAAERLVDQLTRALDRALAAAERDWERRIRLLERQLGRLRGLAEDMSTAVRGGFGEFLDISGGFSTQVPTAEGGFSSAAPTPASIAEFFASQLAGAQQWAGVLEALQAQGASAGLLQQIAGAGPEALGFAQALLQMGPAGIAGINQQFAQIQGLAGGTAQGLSEAYFGSRIDEVSERLGGLREDMREEIRLLNRVIDAFERPRKLELIFRPDGERALKHLILQVLAETGLSRAAL